MSDTPAPQAPVAGADPRAWREMADRLAVEGMGRHHFASTFRAAAAALRDAAEAVTEWDARAGWLATLVIERLGGTPDVPAWVAQSAENYRTLTRERDEAIAALSDAAARASDAPAREVERA